MPYKKRLRTMQEFLFSTLLSNHHKTVIQEALNKGKKVELKHSSFSDPGADYTQIMIDGKILTTIKGY